MAASCLGLFGTYQYTHTRQYKDNPSHGCSLDPDVGNETVWVTKRYIPSDLRVTAPVPRYKLIAPDARELGPPASEWIPPVEATPRTYTRDHEESSVHPSQPSTRCEEWSTLRQILPSRGRSERSRPPNWGTGFAIPPTNTPSTQSRFPHINSPMTRYVDDMHLTNRLFKFH